MMAEERTTAESTPAPAVTKEEKGPKVYFAGFIAGVKYSQSEPISNAEAAALLHGAPKVWLRPQCRPDLEEVWGFILLQEMTGLSIDEATEIHLQPGDKCLYYVESKEKLFILTG